MTTKRQERSNAINSVTDDLNYYGEPYWMVRVTVAVWMVEPPVAVTVTA
jgi:hypothetical protein